MKNRMSRRTFLKTAALSTAVSACPQMHGCDNAANRPNILFLLVDDQRNDTLGCAGHPILKTPVIDNLATDGVRFRNAFVTTSICAASRASLLTGLYERTHGYTFGTPSGCSLKYGYPVWGLKKSNISGSGSPSVFTPCLPMKPVRYPAVRSRAG